MPWTYQTLRDAMTDWAENPEETFLANLDNMIRMAELRIAETVQTPSVREVNTGQMNTGDYTILLPDQFLAPYSLTIADRGGVRRPLLNKEEEFIRAAYPDTGYLNTPEYYALSAGGLIIVGPTPDWTYPYLLSFFSRPLSITETPNGMTYIGTNAEDTLFFACMKNAAVFMKEEQDVVQMYDGLYQEAAYNFRVTGHGRQRKDWFRKPDRRKEVAAESTTPPVQAGGGN